jgi:cell division protein FtsQ
MLERWRRGKRRPKRDEARETRARAAWAWLRPRLRETWRLWPALLCAALVFAAWDQMQRADYFRLARLDIRTGPRVARDDLESFLNARLGQNIFAIDLNFLAAQVRRCPWVKTAVIRRDLPNALSVVIVERRAYALLHLETGSYLVDADGVAFKPVEKGDPRDLPSITGFSVEAFNRGGETADRQAEKIAEAVRLMMLCDKLGALSEQEISEARYDLAGGFTLIGAESGAVIRFGQGDYERKLRALAQVTASLRERVVRARMIDLAIPGRVVVRGLRKGTDV